MGRRWQRAPNTSNLAVNNNEKKNPHALLRKLDVLQPQAQRFIWMEVKTTSAGAIQVKIEEMFLQGRREQLANLMSHDEDRINQTVLMGCRDKRE